MVEKIYMDFAIGHERPLHGRGRSFYGRHARFTPMKKKNIFSGNALVILKTDVDVRFKDADVYFKIQFGRQIVVKLLFDG